MDKDKRKRTITKEELDKVNYGMKKFDKALKWLAQGHKDVEEEETAPQYDEILKSCKEWFNTVQREYADKVKADIAVDDPNEFVANIDSQMYLSQLVVSRADYKPYRFVEYTVMDVGQAADAKPAFWYGDSEGESIREIINNLNKGIRFLSEETGKGEE